MNGENLNDLIWKAKKESSGHQVVLFESQIDEILKLIGYKCRENTKERLRRRLSFPLSLLRPYGIYTRLYLDGDKVEYICGQDWDSEMRTIRECLLEN